MLLQLPLHRTGPGALRPSDLPDEPRDLGRLLLRRWVRVVEADVGAPRRARTCGRCYKNYISAISFCLFLKELPRWVWSLIRNDKNNICESPITYFFFHKSD
jgi:hypothetical protein